MDNEVCLPVWQVIVSTIGNYESYRHRTSIRICTCFTTSNRSICHFNTLRILANHVAFTTEVEGLVLIRFCKCQCRDIRLVSRTQTIVG